MPTVLQLRRGTTAEHSSFTGAEGEVTVNTSKDTLVVHDGSTQGGFEIALADLTNTSAIALTDLSGGTGVTYNNSTGAIAIGQAVGTGDSVTFAGVTAPLTGNVTGNVTGDLTGNADTASAWATARTITLAGDLSGSVSIDGSGDVTLTGSVSGADATSLTGDVFASDGTSKVLENGTDGTDATFTGDVNGVATAATTLATARTIGGVSFNGSANIDLPGVNAGGNQNTSGNAATATALETARAIALGGDVSGTANFDGSAGITITATVADDSHNHVISNVDGLQTALDAKAPLASPTLTGTPTAPTATSGANTTQIATTEFVATAVANVINSAPGALDTLNELAAALGDDANFSTTVTNSIATKLNSSAVSAFGLTLVDDADAATARTTLGLGTAATTAATDYATAAQGSLADSAVQDLADLSITSTAVEINKLDGFTGVVADLNYAKDLRATGVTSTEFDYLDGVTSAIQTQLDGKATSAQGALADSAVQNLADLSITATATELNYVDGVTSDIQTQLNAKQATITGAATTIDTEDLTVSRALVSDGSGKVAVSAVTSTEIGYLDGVTSAIQTQLNAKQATITGAATTIDTENLTVSRALVSDGSGKVAVSVVTSTEIGYLDGVTSAIQTQLNAKQATITGGATTIDTENLTVSRALVSDGSGKVGVSDVTSTELGYLDGVTSSIQTQINANRINVYNSSGTLLN